MDGNYLFSFWIWKKNVLLWTKKLKIITYLYFKKWYECPISYISTVEWPICIGVFSQFQLYTCTYQNYIEEPNPRETSERMNFNVIDQKQLIWKLFIYWNLMSFFHKINVTSSLKLLVQMNQNLVGSIYGRSSIKIAHFVPIRYSAWKKKFGPVKN
jgi:hypothetical protein